MTAPIIGADLLDFADEVLSSPSPGSAALRRVVSTAYYAVFHELVGVAARRLLGADPSHAGDWFTAGRWYSHQDIRVVSSWVIGRTKRRKMPDTVEPLLDSPSADLVAFVKLITELQAARIRADYVHTPAPELEEARRLVDNARLALAYLRNLRGDRVSDNYLMLLLGGPRLPAR